MTLVLGYELDRAVRLLSEEGYNTVLAETSSRKGVENGQKRVVRQRMLDSGDIELVWSAFKTQCIQNG